MIARIARQTVAVLAALVAIAWIARGVLLSSPADFLTFTKLTANNLTAIVVGIVAWRAFRSPTLQEAGKAAAARIKNTSSNG